MEQRSERPLVQSPSFYQRGEGNWDTCGCDNDYHAANTCSQQENRCSPQLHSWNSLGVLDQLHSWNSLEVLDQCSPRSLSATEDFVLYDIVENALSTVMALVSLSDK